jgi:hypothetical protein
MRRQASASQEDLSVSANRAILPIQDSPMSATFIERALKMRQSYWIDSGLAFARLH